MPLLANIFDEKGEIHSRRNWLRWWFGMFLAGFFGIGLCGSFLAVSLWLLGGGSSLGKAMQIVLLVSAGFGVFLAIVMTQRASSDQRFKREVAVRIPGHHPIIGDFNHVPIFNTWHALPVLRTGATVGLRGNGPAPSETESALWQRFISRFDVTMRAATAALMTPPEIFQGCESVTFTATHVQFHQDGGLLVAFDFEAVPENFWPKVQTDHPEFWPCVTFTADLAVLKAEW